MRFIIFWLSFLFIITSCSSLPKINLVDEIRNSEISENCMKLFIAKKTRLVHSIVAEMPNGDKGIFIGVVVMDPLSRTFHCVLMSIEGFVFFDATYNKKVTINRGIYPFDSPTFTKGLINDIMFVFFEPEPGISKAGYLDDGSQVCRYIYGDKSAIDVIFKGNDGWEIRHYSNSYSLLKYVKASLIDKNKMPHRIALVTKGLLGYRLNLKLIEADKVTD